MNERQRNQIKKYLKPYISCCPDCPKPKSDSFVAQQLQDLIEDIERVTQND